MDKRHRKSLRAVIYIKDIVMITGRKFGAARNLYLAILLYFKKEPGQFITIQEFCCFTGISEEIVLSYLN